MAAAEGEPAVQQKRHGGPKSGHDPHPGLTVDGEPRALSFPR
jgi:hypothetical protein